MTLPPVAALSAGDRKRLLIAAGLLARPVLDGAEARKASRVLSHPRWRPLLPCPALSGVKALMTHHAVRLGFDPAHLFDPPFDDEDFEQLGRNDFVRRRELERVLRALIDAGCNRILLVKGAAIAPYWPSPALREMEDADLVVSRADAALAVTTLTSLNWTRTTAGWKHDSGCMLDLSIPSTGLSRHIWQRARPHPLYPAGVREPHPADHLVLISVHAARNRGLRIWRDLCDGIFLLENGARPGIAAEALTAADRFGRSAETSAFLATLNGLMFLTGRIPAEAASARRDALVSLYSVMACDPVSVFGMNALASILITPSAFAGNAWRTLRHRTTGHRDGWSDSQRDPAFGEVPGPSTLARQFLKFRWLLHIACAGRLVHYIRLVRAGNQAFSAGKVFTSADRT